jgi:RNA polymerase sigma-70 factor (ECF subfamily)
MTIDEMLEQGRRAWPDLTVDADAFRRHVEERAGSDAERARLRAADLYLACACASADPRALAELDNKFLCEVAAFLAPTNPDARFVDDVRQRVRERLFVEGKIASYSGRGALASWLRVVTVRVASNLRENPARHVALADDIAAPAIDPELAVIQRRYGEMFRAALSDVLAGLDAEERSLLRFHYLDGLNIDRIAIVFHVSRATVGRRLVATRERIARGVHELLRERLSATPQELDSLFRVVRSQIELSLSGLLAER